jgi:hypothetical protein
VGAGHGGTSCIEYGAKMTGVKCTQCRLRGKVLA